MAFRVTVENLGEIRRGLRAFSIDLLKETRKLQRDLAREARDEARKDFPVGPGKGGHARSGIRSGADGIVPYVSRGGPRWPYLEWIDHGGQLPSMRSGRPARVTREFLKDGRYFFPAVGRVRREIQGRSEKIIENAVRKAGL